MLRLQKPSLQRIDLWLGYDPFYINVPSEHLGAALTQLIRLNRKSNQSCQTSKKKDATAKLEMERGTFVHLYITIERQYP